MNNLKNMLFQLVAQTLSMEEFVHWLYNDEYVNEHILDNDEILELLSINFKSKSVLSEVEKYVFEYYGKEDCLLAVVRINSIHLLEKNINCGTYIDNISHFHEFESDYRLISQVYWFGEDWSMALDGFYSTTEVKHDVKEFARLAVEQLPVQGFSQLLYEGIEINGSTYQYQANQIEEKPKKWFEFWK